MATRQWVELLYSQVADSPVFSYSVDELINLHFYFSVIRNQNFERVYLEMKSISPIGLFKVSFYSELLPL